MTRSYKKNPGGGITAIRGERVGAMKQWKKVIEQKNQIIE